MRNFFNFMMGIFFGALVGATAAILLAPSSGDDLRSELSSRFSRFTEELTQAAHDSRAELEQQLQNLRSQ